MRDRPLAVQVPATSANLGAGYDCFGAAIDQHLVVTVGPPSGRRVVTAGEGAGEVPTDDTNLTWESFVRGCAELEVAVPDVTLHAANQIPLARGMGSSSAAIVAGLVLAKELSGVAVSVQRVAEIANGIEGHPDNVVPALVGGLTASVIDDDGRLVIRRVTPHAGLAPVVFVPTERQLTSEARVVVPSGLPTKAVSEQVARGAHALGGLAGLWPTDAGAVGDRLHEPPRFEVMTSTGALVAALRGRGVHAWLSGAGPAVAASVRARDVDADGALAALGEEYGFTMIATRWDLSGARTCPADGCGLTSLAQCAVCPRVRADMIVALA